MNITRNITLLTLISLLFIQCKKDDAYLHQSDWLTKNFNEWTLSDANTRMTTTFPAPEINIEKINKSNITVYLKMQSNITSIPTRLLDGKLIMTEITNGQIKVIIQSNLAITDFETVAFRYIIEH